MNTRPTLRRRGQTYIFFLVSFGTVFLLCGLGLDSSMIYLSQARLSRACDAAVISGVQNFSRTREEVSQIMRNVAIANYTDLGEVPLTPVQSTEVNGAGGTNFLFTYTSSDGRTEVVNTIATGDRGQVTRASTTGRVPHATAFMGYTGIEELKSYNLNATAKAVRRPRLISLVLDRSGSMISNGGAGALPSAVVTFLSLFDTNSDSIGISSYCTWARLEVAHTNDFFSQGSNKMYRADGRDGDGSPQTTDHPEGMKFEGYTAGAEGLRLGFETMRTNDGYFSEQYQKFIVFFTDGQFNSYRGFFATPAFTNILYVGTNDYDFRYSRTEEMPFSGDNWVVTDSDRTDTQNLPTSEYYGDDYYDGVLDVWLMPGSVLYEYADVSSGNHDNLTNRPVAMWPSLWTNTLIQIRLDDSNKGNAFVQVFPGYFLDGVSRGNNWGSYSNGYNYNNRWPRGNRAYMESNVDDTDGGTGWGSDGSPYWHMAQRLRRNLTRTRWSIFNPEDVDWNRDGTFGDAESYDNSNFYGNHYPRGHFIFFVDSVLCSDQNHGSTNLTDMVPRAVGSGARLFHNRYGVMDDLSDWTRNAPSWLTNQFAAVLVMDMDTVQGDHGVLRPLTYNGYPVDLPTSGGPTAGALDGNMNNYVTNIVEDYDHGYATGITDANVLAQIHQANATNYTGGWILATNLDYSGGMTASNRPFFLHSNSMAYSSRPWYWYDWDGDGRWETYTSTSAPNGGGRANWQSQRIADMARDEDITIYTVNFSAGSHDIMENIANDKDANTFDSSQPEGEYHYVPSNDPDSIEDVFEDIARKIRAVLEQ